MKQVSLRDFQRKASEHINDLPVELLVNGKVIATIVSPTVKQDEEVATIVKENRKLLYSVVEYIEMAKERLRKNGNKTSTPVDNTNVVTVNGNIPGVQKGWSEGYKSGGCGAMNCRSMGKLYKGKGYNSEGEVITKKYLCDKHKQLAEKAGEELEEV